MNTAPVSVDDGLELPVEWRRADALALSIRDSIRPLFHTEGNRLPRLIGNSVLLRIGDRRFLLTAAHVLDEFGAAINIFAPPQFEGLKGDHHTSRRLARADREDDPLDAGVFVFREESRPSTLEGCHITPRALRATTISVEERAHLLVGYPASRAKRVEGNVVVPKWLTYVASEASISIYREQKLHPRQNIILHFDASQARRPDGSVIQAPSFEGVSGTGIWRFATRDDPTRAADNQLVGIFTTYRSGLLIGTRIALHLAIIRAHYPDLATMLPTSTTWPIVVKPGATIHASELSR